MRATAAHLSHVATRSSPSANNDRLQMRVLHARPFGSARGREGLRDTSRGEGAWTCLIRCGGAEPNARLMLLLLVCDRQARLKWISTQARLGANVDDGRRNNNVEA